MLPVSTSQHANGNLRGSPATAVPTTAIVDTETTENQPQQQAPQRPVTSSEQVENTGTDQSRQTSNRGQLLSQLDPSEQRVLEQLKARDREVRAHEQAHLSAAGNLATSGASFSYQRGPDGQRYAIGGEVGISSARVPGDPEATIQRAQQIRRAALAPANPSQQDRSVAAQASATLQQAQAELAQQRAEANGQRDVDRFTAIASVTTESTSSVDIFA